MTTQTHDLDEARALADRYRHEAVTQAARAVDAQGARDALALQVEALGLRLGRAEAREAGLREALTKIRDHEPERRPLSLDNDSCPECKRRSAQRWPPSGLCEEHYGEMSSWRDEAARTDAHQHYAMRDIARSALVSPSPRPAENEGTLSAEAAPTNEAKETR
jgi:hypothetical protein